MSNVTSHDKKPFQWDFDGFCKPSPGGREGFNTTFSVGVFRWIPKVAGNGLKRGKVVKRFSGYTSNPEAVYSKARAFIKSKESTGGGVDV